MGTPLVIDWATWKKGTIPTCVFVSNEQSIYPTSTKIELQQNEAEDLFGIIDTSVSFGFANQILFVPTKNREEWNTLGMLGKNLPT